MPCLVDEFTCSHRQARRTHSVSWPRDIPKSRFVETQVFVLLIPVLGRGHQRPLNLGEIAEQVEDVLKCMNGNEVGVRRSVSAEAHLLGDRVLTRRLGNSSEVRGHKLRKSKPATQDVAA